MIEYESSNGYKIQETVPDTSVSNFLDAVETEVTPTAVTFQSQVASPGGSRLPGKSNWQFVAVLEVNPDDLELLRPTEQAGSSIPPLSDFQVPDWLPDDVRNSFTPRGSGFKLDPEIPAFTMSPNTGPFTHPDYTTGWYIITDEGNLYLHFESS